MLSCPLSGPAQEGAPLKDEIEDWMTEALLRAIVALVRREGADLSARQIGVFLICHLEDEAQTVRGLAAKLEYFENRRLSCVKSSLRIRFGSPKDRPIGSA